MDGGQPIGPCASQPLASGAATCTVTYEEPGAHQITARYAGDTNFTGSSSAAAQLSAVPVPISVLGTITSTMQWNFYYTPTYTLVRNLIVNAALPGSTVVVRCHGHGCPFAQHATVLATSARCGRKARTLHVRPLQPNARLRWSPAGRRRRDHDQHRPAELGRQELPVQGPVSARAAGTNRLPRARREPSRRRLLIRRLHKSAPTTAAVAASGR